MIRTFFYLKIVLKNQYHIILSGVWEHFGYKYIFSYGIVDNKIIFHYGACACMLTFLQKHWHLQKLSCSKAWQINDSSTVFFLQCYSQPVSVKPEGKGTSLTTQALLWLAQTCRHLCSERQLSLAYSAFHYGAFGDMHGVSHQQVCTAPTRL